MLSGMSSGSGIPGRWPLAGRPIVLTCPIRAKQDCLRRWRPAAERAVWTQRVVVLSPTFDEDGGFPQRVEDLPVQELVPELAVEAFVVAVLPWAAWLDVERLHADPAKPVVHGMGGKLRAIVHPDRPGIVDLPARPVKSGNHVLTAIAELGIDHR